MLSSNPSQLTPPSVAIAHTDGNLRQLMRSWLEPAAYRCHEHASARALLDAGDEVSIACIDLGLVDMSGIQLLQRLRARDPEMPVIVTVAAHQADLGIEALRMGAYDYVTTPLHRERLLHAVHRACERRDLMFSVRRLKDALTVTEPEPSSSQPTNQEILPLRILERRAIEQALAATNGRVGEAAKLLGIGRATLYRRLASFDASQNAA